MAVIQFQYDTSVDPKAGGGGYTLCPKGRHHIKLTNFVQQEAKPGKEYGQIQCEYSVVSTSVREAEGKNGRIWFSLSPKAAAYFLNPMIQASGASFQSVKVQTAQGVLDVFQVDTDDLEGCVVLATCQHDESGQRPRENWGNYEVSDHNPRLAPSGPTAAAPAMPAPSQGAVPPRRMPGR
jgi:hypothetical protein